MEWAGQRLAKRHLTTASMPSPSLRWDAQEIQMEEGPAGHSDPAPSTARGADRQELAARLGVQGDFARVPQLARALGISANSIYAQMRLGTFPMPHRRVGNVVVVKLDDYMDWFVDQPTASAISEPNATPNAATLARDMATPWTATSRGVGKETPKQRGERFKKEVREELRRSGLA